MKRLEFLGRFLFLGVAFGRAIRCNLLKISLHCIAGNL